METMLVRLKPRDPRRGFVLRRFTYRGIKFQGERGWYRVEREVADYLRTVRQRAADPHSPPAFDVCTEAEARRVEADEEAAGAARSAEATDVTVSTARALTTDDLPQADSKSRKSKKG